MSHARDNARLARTGIPTVATAAALRDLVEFSGDPPEAVQTLGALTVGDGGGGLWRWNPAATAADNLGTVLQPTGGGATGRWIRVESEKHVINVAWFGISEGADNAAAIQAAIDTATDFKTDGENTYLYNSWRIDFPGGLLLPFGSKLKISPDKNIFLSCSSTRSTTLKYTGVAGVVGIEFQPGGRRKYVGIINLTIHGGDVAVIGGHSGLELFDRMTLVQSPNKGLWFVDSADYSDGVGGEYPTPPYTGPNVSAGINTVNFQINECEFYESQGNCICIESTTILLGRIRKPRFNDSLNAPLVIDATNVVVEQGEFQGVGNNATEGYIWFPCEKSPNSHNRIINCRFGSETTGLGGPPVRTIVIGDTGAYVDKPQSFSFNIFDGCMFYGDAGGTTMCAFYQNHAAYDNKIKNCSFTNINGPGIIDDNARTNGETGSVRNYWRSNSITAVPTDTDYAAPSGSWMIRDRGGSVTRPPTVEPEVNAGTGAIATLSGVCTDTGGRVNVTCGTGTSAGNMVTVTFSEGFVNSPAVTLTGRNLTASTAGLYISAVGRDSFTVRAGGGMSDGSSYHFNYLAADLLGR